MSKQLREGYTTGTSAAAAARVALLALVTGRKPSSVLTPLPNGEHLEIPIHAVMPDTTEGNGMRGVVIKDGGDDPDVTHGKEIHSVVTFLPTAEKSRVILTGGKGVGTVTLPGLPVPPGNPAINPAPRQQMEQTILNTLDEMHITGVVHVRIEVPEGEELARKTMNPKLGIVGGISILGTRGTVRPFSNESWQASVSQALSVAKADGLKEIVFTTGGRSERFFRELYPETHKLGVVQVADFFAYSMKEAARMEFTKVTWSLFFGKLVKQAQGLRWTHAKGGELDFSILADVLNTCGARQEHVAEVLTANTAMQVQHLLINDPAAECVYDSLVQQARQHALAYAQSPLDISYVLFDFDGHPLYVSHPSGDNE